MATDSQVIDFLQKRSLGANSSNTALVSVLETSVVTPSRNILADEVLLASVPSSLTADTTYTISDFESSSDIVLLGIGSTIASYLYDALDDGTLTSFTTTDDANFIKLTYLQLTMVPGTLYESPSYYNTLLENALNSSTFPTVVYTDDGTQVSPSLTDFFVQSGIIQFMDPEVTLSDTYLFKQSSGDGLTTYYLDDSTLPKVTFYKYVGDKLGDYIDNITGATTSDYVGDVADSTGFANDVTVGRSLTINAIEPAQVITEALPTSLTTDATYSTSNFAPFTTHVRAPEIFYELASDTTNTGTMAAQYPYLLQYEDEYVTGSTTATYSASVEFEAGYMNLSNIATFDTDTYDVGQALSNTTNTEYYVFSVSVWVYLPTYTPSDEDTVLAIYNADETKSLGIYVTASEVLTLRMDGVDLLTFSSLTWGVWNHIVLVSNGTIIKCFVNAIATDVYVTKPTFDDSDTYSIKIEGNTTGASLFISDLAIFDYALDDATISDICDGGYGSEAVDSYNPPLFYPLSSDATGTTRNTYTLQYLRNATLFDPALTFSTASSTLGGSYVSVGDETMITGGSIVSTTNYGMTTWNNTITFWIHAADANIYSNDRNLLLITDTEGATYLSLICLGSSAGLYFEIDGSSATGLSFTYDTWSMVSIVLDGDTATLYVDDTSVQSHTITNYLTDTEYTLTGFQGIDSYTTYFRDFAIWGTALTSDDISALYAAGYGATQTTLTYTEAPDSLFSLYTDSYTDIVASLTLSADLGTAPTPTEDATLNVPVVQFDGTFIMSGSLSTLSLTEAAVGFWFYHEAQTVDARGNDSHIIALCDDSTGAYMVIRYLEDESGSWAAAVYSQSVEEVYTITTPTEDAWNYILFQQTDTYFDVFVNGEQCVRVRAEDGNTIYTDSFDSLVIGGTTISITETTNVPVAGYISDVRVYSSTLEPADVLRIYGTGTVHTDYYTALEATTNLSSTDAKLILDGLRDGTLQGMVSFTDTSLIQLQGLKLEYSSDIDTTPTYTATLLDGAINTSNLPAQVFTSEAMSVEVAASDAYWILQGFSSELKFLDADVTIEDVSVFTSYFDSTSNYPYVSFYKYWGETLEDMRTELTTLGDTVTTLEGNLTTLESTLESAVAALGEELTTDSLVAYGATVVGDTTLGGDLSTNGINPSNIRATELPTTLTEDTTYTTAEYAPFYTHTNTPDIFYDLGEDATDTGIMNGQYARTFEIDTSYIIASSASTTTFGLTIDERECMAITDSSGSGQGLLSIDVTDWDSFMGFSIWYYAEASVITGDTEIFRIYDGTEYVGLDLVVVDSVLYCSVNDNGSVTSDTTTAIGYDDWTHLTFYVNTTGCYVGINGTRITDLDTSHEGTWPLAGTTVTMRMIGIPSTGLQVVSEFSCIHSDSGVLSDWLLNIYNGGNYTGDFYKFPLTSHLLPTVVPTIGTTTFGFDWTVSQGAFNSGSAYNSFRPYNGTDATECAAGLTSTDWAAATNMGFVNFWPGLTFAIWIYPTFEGVTSEFSILRLVRDTDSVVALQFSADTDNMYITIEDEVVLTVALAYESSTSWNLYSLTIQDTELCVYEGSTLAGSVTLDNSWDLGITSYTATACYNTIGAKLYYRDMSIWGHALSADEIEAVYNVDGENTQTFTEDSIVAHFTMYEDAYTDSVGGLALVEEQGTASAVAEDSTLYVPVFAYDGATTMSCDISSLGLDGEWTLALWHYAGDIGNDERFVGLSNGTTEYIYLRRGSAGRGVTHVVGADDTSVPSWYENGEYGYFTTSAWNHIVLTCDSSSIKAYCNGVAMTRTPYFDTVFGSFQYLSIGGRFYEESSTDYIPASGNYTGDIRIYSRCLSHGEIRRMYATTAVHPDTSTFLTSTGLSTTYIDAVLAALRNGSLSSVVTYTDSALIRIEGCGLEYASDIGTTPTYSSDFLVGSVHTGTWPAEVYTDSTLATSVSQDTGYWIIKSQDGNLVFLDLDATIDGSTIFTNYFDDSTLLPYMSFYVYTGTTLEDVTDIMTVSGGNVGLNNTDPSYPLDVAGEFRVAHIAMSGAHFLVNWDESTAKTDVIISGSRTSETSESSGITFRNYWDSDNSEYQDYAKIVCKADTNGTAADIGGILDFYTSNVGTNTLALRINEEQGIEVTGDATVGGDLTVSGTAYLSALGVNQTSPSYTLDIGGDARIYNSDVQFWIQNSTDEETYIKHKIDSGGIYVTYQGSRTTESSSSTIFYYYNYGSTGSVYQARTKVYSTNGEEDGIIAFATSDGTDVTDCFWINENQGIEVLEDATIGGRIYMTEPTYTWWIGESTTLDGGLGFGTNDDGERAFLTYTADVNTIDFTGQHYCETTIDVSDTDIQNMAGLIVRATGEYSSFSSADISINESLPVVSLTTQTKDKAVFGVISDIEEANTQREYKQGSFVTVFPKETTDRRFIINSLGEGAIWVCDEGGDFENGDYIQSASLSGYGMQQSDSCLHNYTVAKITCNVPFSDWEYCTGKFETREVDGVKCCFVGCTYHCG
jgi:hypothetical protein